MENTKKNKEQPRLTVEIDPELHNKIKQQIPWGYLKPIINTVMRDVIRLTEEHDTRLVLGAILSEDITLKDYLKKYSSDGHKQPEG